MDLSLSKAHGIRYSFVMGKFIIPSSEYTISFSRAGGTGGQNVNKVNTKATLQWNVSESVSLPPAVKERFIAKYFKRIAEDGHITLTSQAHRTQHLNIADVIKKLHEMIDSITEAPKVRKPTKPTKSSVRERIKAKKAHGDKKRSRSSKIDY